MFSWSVPSAFGVTSSPPELGGVPVWAGWSERALFIPLPRLLSLSAYKITTFLQLTSSQFILTHPNSSIIIQTNHNLTQIFTEITEIFVLWTLQSHTEITEITEIFVLRTLQSHTDIHRNHRNFSSFGLFYCPVVFYCPAEIKEIKEIFRFAYCAQPVPKALSVISFISAGLEILCAACAEGTFCDFREFLCEKIFLLFPLFDFRLPLSRLGITHVRHGSALAAPSALRDLKICVICVICVPLPLPLDSVNPACLLRYRCLLTL